MPKTFTLPPEADSMCAFCLTKATHFIVVSYSYGSLKPACSEHASREIY